MLNTLIKNSKIIFVLTGLIIGAGFASGREILEFFSIKSRSDFTPIILASLLFGAIIYQTLRKARRYNITDFDSFALVLCGKWSFLIRLFVKFFMFATFFIMLSGGGSAFHRLCGTGTSLGSVLTAFICFIILIFGEKGLVATNTILVPIMVFGIIYVSFSATLSVFASSTAGSLFSAVCYASFNTITSAGVLVPLSKGLSEKTIKTVSIITGGIIGILILIIWLAINTNFSRVINEDLPLLALTEGIAEKLYGGILLMAIITTAVSNGFGILNSIKTEKKTDRVILSALLCLIALPFSLFGFSVLVSRVYFVCGVIGLLWTMRVIYPD